MANSPKTHRLWHNTPQWVWRRMRNYWQAGWWNKLVASGVVFVLLCGSGMYGIARWYQHTQAKKPLVMGVTFITEYANYLGVDAHRAYQAVLNDLQVKHLRLVSYWSTIESTKGTYNFAELDYQMDQAAAHGAKVSLAVGLRQPRWPECHPPTWVDTSKSGNTWRPALNNYITAVVERYRNHPALQSYQLENEFFNTFGNCNDYDRTRLNDELKLVQGLDTKHPVIISRSNNYAGFSIRKPLPDTVGLSLYRRVWDGTLTKRYVQYPFPSWYYAFLAGGQQIVTGTPSVIHELQTEPWPSGGKGILDTSLAEQDKTLDAKRFKSTVQFAKQTGIKQVDLWGAEYWYYRAHVLHEPSVWNAARQEFQR